jgi:transcriptional regulator with XRE-family HTH domain
MNHFELRAALRSLRISQADVARLCGVTPAHMSRVYNGKKQVSAFIATTLYLMNGSPARDIIRGCQEKFEPIRADVFRDESYRDLAFRFHPDRSGRDTTEEMQLINRFR